MSGYGIMFDNLVLLHRSKWNYYNGLNDGYGEILNLFYGDDKKVITQDAALIIILGYNEATPLVCWG